MKHSVHASKRTVILIVAGIVALGLVSYGAWGFWQRYQATHRADATIPFDAVSNSTDNPSETPPTAACENYKVASEQPRKIVIESIGIDACIQKVGIDQHGAVAVPSNIHLAGWYNGSSVPGQPGVSLIDGHLGGRYTNDAVFASLKDAATGDTITIELGDHSKRDFIIQTKTNYPTDEVMQHAFEPIKGDESQLNLITCYGNYGNGTYDQRLLVQAILAK